MLDGKAANKKGVVLSGMRPTGKLHLGHLSVLENWAALQKEYRCYYFIADWHARTTSFDQTDEIDANRREMALDWLSVGLDPNLSSLFVQSQIKEHAEMYLLFSMLTPLSWLERVPAFKEQICQFKQAGRDISTHGFLGYPLLMAVDILIYKANFVPVGEDQLAHLEFSRELARRFNHMYGKNVLIEPQPLLAKIKLLPGTDNRKMSKSYGNYISISASPDEVWEKVQQMITDPARIRKNDLGHPEICTVFTYHTIYNEKEKEETEISCRGGKIGCYACKKRLAENLNMFLAPIGEKRRALEKNSSFIDDILNQGKKEAAAAAAINIEAIRDAMKL
jgi:tryptophanyl-tRNA synthetase